MGNYLLTTQIQDTLMETLLTPPQSPVHHELEIESEMKLEIEPTALKDWSDEESIDFIEFDELSTKFNTRLKIKPKELFTIDSKLLSPVSNMTKK
jgi:hypothetical protein